jgi:hypothetical protein
LIIDNDNTKSDNKRDNEDKIIDRIVSENGYNIINVNENERENENIVYIDVRGSVCSEPPTRITNNRTPPPCFSPHITTIKVHLILQHFKFCLANVHSCQYGQGTSAICFI